MAVDAVVTKVGGFGYGGRRVFTGEIIRMQGYPNDGKLLTLDYLTRYDSSNHDHADECEGAGRRFISRAHYLSYVRINAEEAEVDAMRRQALTRDQTQHEYQTIESRGLRVHEQAGPPQVSLAGLDLNEMKTCPIDGCDERVVASELHIHVEGHSTDLDEPEAPVRKPAVKRPAVKKAVAKKPAVKKPVTKRRVAA